VVRRMMDLRRAPWRRILYLADLAHFPYGPRPEGEVRDLALAGVRLLAERGADLVAVACNTAASSGVRSGAPLPVPVPVLDIVGPGSRQVATLARATRAAGVLVLGTEGTVRRRVWERALRDAGYAGPTIGWACPHLASAIEEGAEDAHLEQAVREALAGLGNVAGVLGAGQAGRADHRDPVLVVLGCTHYPLAAACLERVLGQEVLQRPVRVVDPASALAAEVAATAARTGPGATALGREGFTGGGDERAVDVVFLATARPAHLRERLARLLAGPPPGVAAPGVGTALGVGTAPDVEEVPLAIVSAGVAPAKG